MHIPWSWIIPVTVIVTIIVFKQLSQVPSDKARSLLAAGVPVIDVRSESEFAADHIPCAINLPLGVISDKIAAVVPDKNAPVFLHCLSGTRSAMACSKLRALGYTQVFNLGSLRRARSLCAATGR